MSATDIDSRLQKLELKQDVLSDRVQSKRKSIHIGVSAIKVTKHASQMDYTDLLDHQSMDDDLNPVDDFLDIDLSGKKTRNGKKNTLKTPSIQVPSKRDMTPLSRFTNKRGSLDVEVAYAQNKLPGLLEP